ncbi:GNAT family N-acetyltransferase [Staphylococcus agnetis]|uniref:GNAT family N-acetyltransferase n=2 Tax=Staphylococcus agnetis TaxID=985762 RepID=UPI000D1BADF2|nr:GNAT family N-acetyltransferase [Staphylococcus agnetis]MCO4327681.1 GNAT family N-acetyltransferase [Staphylococcus agnetis]MCO4339226.1 GNAT family N-acetyltransferase [Staphylococcus agnetis]MCO4342013.1 GNAT family N-acetyltransferase [Staphylococcus agnetis]MCO4343850.1 GNAT family N-acetyltransferase [Staphylococcus agnetis]MCO4346048.1 GNAT family N-acetyltransferase [Staphylococcus agnetis]
MNIVSKERLHTQDIKSLFNLYASVGWHGHTSEKIAAIYKKSTHIVLAYKENSLIGCGRALSDGVFNAAIYDIVVHPHYHRQGIGHHIVTQLMHDIGDVSCIHLISTLGNEAFYTQCGFRKLTTGMAIYQNPKLATQYLE